MAEGNLVKEQGHGSERRNNLGIREEIRNFLTSSITSVDPERGKRIGSLCSTDGNRKVLIEEWTRAVESARDHRELTSVNYKAREIHLSEKLLSRLRSVIETTRPELKGKDFEIVANNPEYDGIRKTVGEKLKTLGLTNSGMPDKGLENPVIENVHTEHTFALLHPNPYVEQPTYETKRRGLLQKPVRVRVPTQAEKHDTRFRPFEQLMEELLRYKYNQPQSIPAVPPKA